MNINERIRDIRKTLGLNQKEFGERIGLGQAGISWMEKSGNTVIDQNIKMICNAFHVNEAWLRYGTGEMEASPANLLDVLAERYNLDAKGRALVESFLALTNEQQDVIVAAVCSAADKIQSAEEASKKAERDAEAHALLQHELDAEDGTKLSHSALGSSAAESR